MRPKIWRWLALVILATPDHDRTRGQVANSAQNTGMIRHYGCSKWKECLDELSALDYSARKPRKCVTHNLVMNIPLPQNYKDVRKKRQYGE